MFDDTPVGLSATASGHDIFRDDDDDDDGTMSTGVLINPGTYAHISQSAPAPSLNVAPPHSESPPSHPWQQPMPSNPIPPSPFIDSPLAARLGFSINHVHRLLICNDCSFAVAGLAFPDHYRNCKRNHQDKGKGKAVTQGSDDDDETSPRVVGAPSVPRFVLLKRDSDAFLAELQGLGIHSEACKGIPPRTDGTPDTTPPLSVRGLPILLADKCPSCGRKFIVGTSTVKNHHNLQPKCPKPSSKLERVSIQRLYATVFDPPHEVTPDVPPPDPNDAKALLEAEYRATKDAVVRMTSTQTGRRFNSPFLTYSGFADWAKYHGKGAGVPKDTMQAYRAMVRPGDSDDLATAWIPLIASAYVDEVVGKFNHGNDLVRRVLKAGK